MTTNKICFFVSDKRHFDYFKNVFDALNQIGVPFDMIINDTRNELNRFISDEYHQKMVEIAQSMGHPYRLLSSVIESRTRYVYIVTTYSFKYTIRTDSLKIRERLVHYAVYILSRIGNLFRLVSFKSLLQEFINNYDAQFRISPEKAIAEKVILFPKGLDINLKIHPDPAILDKVDEYFCHGQIDRDLIQSRTGKTPTMIGYPRYDTLHKLKDEYKKQLIAEFDLNPSKKIISWIPTYVNRNGNPDYNMDSWMPFIKPLLNDYEIIVRPHPKRIEFGADNLTNQLLKLGFKVDVMAERDMNQLYSASDFIFCDYGGVVFSSIYTNSNLLLLNHSEHQLETVSHRNLFVYKIREQLPHLSVDELNDKPEHLSDLLSNDMIWDGHKKTRENLLNECFGGIKVGEGSHIAANKIKELLEAR
jgi:hypothetical protein